MSPACRESRPGICIRSPCLARRGIARTPHLIAIVAFRAAERPPKPVSILARRLNDIRSWSTSMPRSWRTRKPSVSPCPRTGPTFPRKRHAAWRATRAAWSCSTAGTVASWKSSPGPARFRRRSGAPCSIATMGAASRAVACAQARPITSITGRKAARRRLAIWRCCAVGITGRCTRKVIGLSVYPTVNSDLRVPTDGCSRMRRAVPGYLTIRSRFCEHATRLEV